MSRRAIKTLLKLGLTAIILGAVLWKVGVGRIADAIQRLDAGAWLIAFGAFFVLHGLGTLKWRFLLKLTGARLELVDAFRCYAAGLFANLCLPTMIGGDVLRTGLAMAATRQKTAVVLGAILDRAWDFAGLVLLGVIGFLVAWHPSSAHLDGEGRSHWTPFLVAGGLAALGIVAAVVLWRRWRPKGRAHKLLLEALVAIRRVRRRWPLALFGFLVSATLQFLLLLVHRQLGVRIGMPSDLTIWLFIWPVSKLVAMVPISFAGLGVREAAFWALSRPFGVVKDVAVAASLAWQAVMIVGGLLSGLVWILLTWRPAGKLTPGRAVAP
jgi:glycosyltransferase 2 family protein